LAQAAQATSENIFDLGLKSHSLDNTMWFQPIEWTAAACVVTFQGCVTVLVGVMLFVPSALGKKDGWYKAYYQKNAALYGSVADVSADILPKLEIEIGAHISMWGICTMAVLMAGVEAQIMCILELAPMLALILYFFRVNEKVYAIVSAAFVCVLCYFGFLPTPTAPSVQWQAAGIFIALHSVLCLLPGICFLVGKTEDIYKSQPETAAWFSNREREILLGTTLVGVTAAGVGATITNVASNYCLLATPGLLVIGIGHWISTGDKKQAKPSLVFMLLFLCFGIFPRVMQ